MTTGFFLVIEGTEGAGKSTLVKGLAAKLRELGPEPLLVREPGGTPVAERIRQLLLDPEHSIGAVSELYLFLAARAELVADVIRPALDAGRIVVADRFQLSTEAYQCGGRGVDRALFREANRAATGGLEPSLTLVLDLPPEMGFTRIRTAGLGLDRIEREGEAFHERVAEVFRTATGPGIIHLDAGLPPEQVLLMALQHVRAALPEAREAPKR